jgi:hypothetical protein
MEDCHQPALRTLQSLDLQLAQAFGLTWLMAASTIAPRHTPHSPPKTTTTCPPNCPQAPAVHRAARGRGAAARSPALRGRRLRAVALRGAAHAGGRGAGDARAHHDHAELRGRRPVCAGGASAQENQGKAGLVTWVMQWAVGGGLAGGATGQCASLAVFWHMWPPLGKAPDSMPSILLLAARCCGRGVFGAMPVTPVFRAATTGLAVHHLNRRVQPAAQRPGLHCQTQGEGRPWGCRCLV